jgi:hypothetical protein
MSRSHKKLFGVNLLSLLQAGPYGFRIAKSSNLQKSVSKFVPKMFYAINWSFQKCDL